MLFSNVGARRTIDAYSGRQIRLSIGTGDRDLFKKHDRQGKQTMERFFNYVEKYIAVALLGLMAVVVVSATLEVAYLVATNIFNPPGYFIGVEDLFRIFGLFLMVLIGLELLSSIRFYLRDSSIHAEMMLLIAMTAITRKIVILDAKVLDPMVMFAIGFIVIALAVGYFLVRRSNVERSGD